MLLGKKIIERASVNGINLPLVKIDNSTSQRKFVYCLRLCGHIGIGIVLCQRHNFTDRSYSQILPWSDPCKPQRCNCFVHEILWCKQETRQSTNFEQLLHSQKFGLLKIASYDKTFGSSSQMRMINQTQVYLYIWSSCVTLC